MPLGPPRLFSDHALRWVCHNCGERWTEDNIDGCVRCGEDFCANCGTSVSLPGWAEKVWLCRYCADVVKKDPSKAPVPPPPIPRLFWPEERGKASAADVARHNLKVVLMRDGAGERYIEWPPYKEFREVLTKSLEVLGFELERSGADFDVTPRLLPECPALLIFTTDGRDRLKAATCE